MRPWPNWIGHLTTDQKVGGSNPPGRTKKVSSKGFEAKRAPTFGRKSRQEAGVSKRRGGNARFFGMKNLERPNPPGRIFLQFYAG